MSTPLVEPLTASPFRSLLELRFASSARADRALVLISHDGTALVGAGSGAWPGHPRPTLLRVLGGSFPQSGWVSLVEQSAWLDIPPPAGDPMPRPAVRHAVTWQVGDPAVIVRNRITADTVPAWIAQHIAQHDVSPGAPYAVPEAGIVYRVLQQPGTGPAGAHAAPPTPLSWDSETFDSFRFFRELISPDPRGLAAMWLLYHPQDAERVLKWSVDNRHLLLPAGPEPGPDSWETSLATALRDLSPADRAFVGVTMAGLLNDLGVPEARSALDQLEDR
ncbi:hypothetical protein [Streptomyces marincola]|uniref:Uncharacterized protein n=1 Tax=Streptomyces marincola TaxID=2878388 RepID=A0A1W7CZ07_9ACTN|nr:hypothetical protein [Streptomyces marincola]ARQ69986.1 hypothetical protein CAG99_14975 [Streptomyces marincola]